MARDHSIPIFLVVTAMALGVALVIRPLGPEQASAGSTAGSGISYQVSCASCHGSRGEGNRELGAPAIASLPEWFVVEQLAKFREGLRGRDPRDVRGGQMRAAVLPLSAEALGEAISELLSLPDVPPPPTRGGDTTRGGESYRELCMECHRYNGRGELAFRSAPLAVLPDWYLAAQIEKFLDGSRGGHPDDEAGAKMREMAKRPRDAEELANILAYVSTLAREYPEGE